MGPLRFWARRHPGQEVLCVFLCTEQVCFSHGQVIEENGGMLTV
jgi:hypothetical protein